MLSKGFRIYTWFVLVNIFLVIIAGSIVRTTQSGMGCPDWPTCFGSAIPPTQLKEVQFQPQHLYKKGQFIIHNDSLKYAVKKFVSGAQFSTTDWKQYEKHNYATFNVVNTWIEYLNRLLGALLGIFILLLFVWSLWYYKQSKTIIALSFLLVLLTGFQAWLGKTVVDSNLALIKITLHMFGALAMVFLCQYILFLAKGNPYLYAPKKTITLNALLFVLVVTQIVLGTHVRGEIDQVAAQFSYLNRSGWIAQLNAWFYIHRSFSLAVGTLALYLFINNRGVIKMYHAFRYPILIIFCEIAIGVVLAYADFPPVAQPLHLLLSSILIALFFNNLLRLKQLPK